MKLYHYRSIENAILELKNGTFHFSTREELNDPLEGYLKIYWQGDKIAWEGLLKNYVCSVDNAIMLYLVQADLDMLRENTLAIDIYSKHYMTRDKIWSQLTKKFIADEEVKKVISFYGDNNLKVYKDELAFLLRYFHTKALVLCIQSHMEHGSMDESEGQRFLDVFEDKTTDIPENLFEKNLPSEKERKILFKVVKNYMQDTLEYFYLSNSNMLKSNSEDATKISIDNDSEKENQMRNWLSIVADFPDTYTSQLIDFIYPSAYITCFSAKNNDSVMWGNYADNHKGVCLIYETDNDNKIEIMDNSGWETEENDEIVPTYSWSKKLISKVRYGDEICERNFFESLGRLNLLQIRSWLTSGDEISCCYEIYKNKKEWHKQYWKIFELKNCHKMKEWAYEEEYRLIIDNTFVKREKTVERNLSYNPKVLKGVIFGIRTSEYDKKRIIDAMKKSNYSSVIFYQAEYDEEIQKINIRKKNGWNIK